VRLDDRQRQLDARLHASRDLWHPQPFRAARPAWCARWPALTMELLALSDADAARLNDDGDAALALLAGHVPEVAALAPLASLPQLPAAAGGGHGARWAWEIPGRKRQQIEAFAAAARPCGAPVVDWCGGKGHLGRLLAVDWGVPVRTLEIDAHLCAAGAGLAGRVPVAQEFVVADVLTATNWPRPGQHAVALHACGDLHRSLIERGAAAGLRRFDVAPCCYHRGVAERYRPLSGTLHTQLTRDDLRLAVTEAVTASPRLVRQRDREMAWKLGFDAWRRMSSPAGAYQTFKPVPAAWFRGGFADFLARMAAREGMPLPDAGLAESLESSGWHRQCEVMRLSIVRHAFRRALEVWLALDLAMYLAGQGYAVDLGTFCERRVTPRNLLISAQLSG
jgi:hypothetical protein